MLWAAFTRCFFGFLRSGEVCSNNAQANTPEDLSADCISVDNIQSPQIVKLHLKVSKTDLFREGRDIFLPRTLDGLSERAGTSSFHAHWTDYARWWHYSPGLYAEEVQQAPYSCFTQATP